eukprot:gene24038-9616_t
MVVTELSIHQVFENFSTAPGAAPVVNKITAPGFVSLCREIAICAPQGCVDIEVVQAAHQKHRLQEEKALSYELFCFALRDVLLVGRAFQESLLESEEAEDGGEIESLQIESIKELLEESVAAQELESIAELLEESVAAQELESIAELLEESATAQELESIAELLEESAVAQEIESIKELLEESVAAQELESIAELLKESATAQELESIAELLEEVMQESNRLAVASHAYVNHPPSYVPVYTNWMSQKAPPAVTLPNIYEGKRPPQLKTSPTALQAQRSAHAAANDGMSPSQHSRSQQKYSPVASSYTNNGHGAGSSLLKGTSVADISRMLQYMERRLVKAEGQLSQRQSRISEVEERCSDTDARFNASEETIARLQSMLDESRLSTITSNAQMARVEMQVEHLKASKSTQEEKWKIAMRGLEKQLVTVEIQTGPGTKFRLRQGLGKAAQEKKSKLAMRGLEKQPVAVEMQTGPGAKRTAGSNGAPMKIPESAMEAMQGATSIAAEAKLMANKALVTSNSLDKSVMQLAGKVDQASSGAGSRLENRVLLMEKAFARGLERDEPESYVDTSEPKGEGAAAKVDSAPPAEAPAAVESSALPETAFPAEARSAVDSSAPPAEAHSAEAPPPEESSAPPAEAHPPVETSAPPEIGCSPPEVVCETAPAGDKVADIGADGEGTAVEGEVGAGATEAAGPDEATAPNEATAEDEMVPGVGESEAGKASEGGADVDAAAVETPVGEEKPTEIEASVADESKAT